MPVRSIIIRRISILFIFFLLSAPVLAWARDSDKDGVPDNDEIFIYHTDPNRKDTDGDGYNDWIELNTGYSPYNKEFLKLEESDADGDGLSDRMELNFGADPTRADTDEDGYSDGVEIEFGFSPTEGGRNELPKRIEINTGAQELSIFLGGVRMGTYPISSGKPSMPTPHGHFHIANRHPKAWSGYGLWMPYWLGLDDGPGGYRKGSFGIHELPVWPNGYREGEDHLGTPVSHGCVRLGVGAAERVYNWVRIKTPVFIY